MTINFDNDGLCIHEELSKEEAEVFSRLLFCDLLRHIIEIRKLDKQIALLFEISNGDILCKFLTAEKTRHIRDVEKIERTLLYLSDKFKLPLASNFLNKDENHNIL